LPRALYLDMARLTARGLMQNGLYGHAISRRVGT
jgi:hypothetical protein